jgi:hypothetical protein
MNLDGGHMSGVDLDGGRVGGVDLDDRRVVEVPAKEEQGTRHEP